MAHIVKCSVCGIQFDRDKIQAVKTGARRYAHYECSPDGELVPLPIKPKDEADEIREYAKKILKDTYNPAIVNRQIKKFTTELGFSYSGILKSLVYWYEVKHNSPEKANGGIGIVEYCYQQAYNYYLALFQAAQSNQNKDIVSYTSQVKEVTIKPPVADIKKHFFNFLEEDLDEE